LCRRGAESLDEAALLDVALTSVCDHQGDYGADSGDSRESQLGDIYRCCSLVTYVGNAVQDQVSNCGYADTDDGSPQHCRQQRQAADPTADSARCSAPRNADLANPTGHGLIIAAAQPEAGPFTLETATNAAKASSALTGTS
jgi:hypothetical protein